MEKDFLKLRSDSGRLFVLVLIFGILISAVMGVLAWKETGISEGVLIKNETGDGSYEQELLAVTDSNKIWINVQVDEKKLSEEEILAEFDKAEAWLDQQVIGENEGFQWITTDLCFPENAEGTAVAVEWTETVSEYFTLEGRFREDVEITESIEKEVTAILCCQDQTRDYRRILTFAPRSLSQASELLKEITVINEEEDHAEYLILPETYREEKIQWRKKMDPSFIYVAVLTAAAMLLLKMAQQNDQRQEQKQRREALTQDYPAVVSKFAMLLSAGLSIRNAWERIVSLERGKEDIGLAYQEMSRSARGLQKGVSELEIYEEFGNRVGLISYKKLMALFVSHKKRGSINLLDAMNQEMLLAWEEQRRIARAQGEKIGTKLLLPMMGMLFVIFLIILVPAFISF